MVLSLRQLKTLKTAYKDTEASLRGSKDMWALVQRKEQYIHTEHENTVSD